MDAHVVVGSTLAAGLVVFLIGAGAWRLEYEQPLPDVLRLIHEDRRRRAWIHLWMVPALFITSAGTAGLVVLLDGPLARVLGTIGAVTYGLGALCWMIALLHRLTIVPWAAAAYANTGVVDPVFLALDRLASWLYGTHMSSAYAASALLGWTMLVDGALVPTWLAWSGIGWGMAALLGIVATRFAGPFNPPFLAHLYTGALGVALLLRHS